MSANHVRTGEREALFVLFSGATRQLALFCADDPANGIVVFLAARRASEGNGLGFLLFRIELSLVHDFPALCVPTLSGSSAVRSQRIARFTYGRRLHCNKFQARIAPAREPMFERGDDMMTIAAQSAMIAVVQHDDVAVRPVRARDAR